MSVYRQAVRGIFDIEIPIQSMRRTPIATTTDCVAEEILFFVCNSNNFLGGKYQFMNLMYMYIITPYFN